MPRPSDGLPPTRLPLLDLPYKQHQLETSVQISETAGTFLFRPLQDPEYFTLQNYGASNMAGKHCTTKL